jgi:hypothetical protein
LGLDDRGARAAASGRTDDDCFADDRHLTEEVDVGIAILVPQ